MRFIGVSTASSSIMKIFPSWSKTLNLNAVITGIDIPLNASKGDYVSAITQMINDKINGRHIFTLFSRNGICISNKINGGHGWIIAR